MTQIRMTPRERLARAGLWGLLVGAPLAFYLLLLGGYMVALGPLRGDTGALLLSFGWPVLLALLGAGPLLAVLRLVLKRRKLPDNWWRAPVAVGLGAYLVGCLLQFLLPVSLLHWYASGPTMLGWKPLYWWPLFNGFSGEYGGWTVAPPLSLAGGYALIPPVEASAIKLGVLLATLRFYRRSSAAPVQVA